MQQYLQRHYIGGATKSEKRAMLALAGVMLVASFVFADSYLRCGGLGDADTPGARSLFVTILGAVHAFLG